jgi:hypothetical protein
MAVAEVDRSSVVWLLRCLCPQMSGWRSALLDQPTIFSMEGQYYIGHQFDTQNISGGVLIAVLEQCSTAKKGWTVIEFPLALAKWVRRFGGI